MEPAWNDKLVHSCTEENNNFATISITIYKNMNLKEKKRWNIMKYYEIILYNI